MTIGIQALAGFLLLPPPIRAATPRFLAVSPADDFLREIDPNTGAALDPFPQVLVGDPGAAGRVDSMRPLRMHIQ